MPLDFRRRRPEEPEVNLIPFIDVLLVILIFLMLSTTYSRLTELQITLPAANAEPPRDKPREVSVAVGADGRWSVDHKPVDGSVEALAAALAAAAKNDRRAVVIVSADAAAAHQSVVSVMDAARRAGLARLAFAAQGQPGASAGGAGR